MGKYLPYSGTHSIQEAVVALHFRGPFSAEAVGRAQSNAQVELGKAFPRSGGIHELRVNQTGQGVVLQESGSPRLAGFELSRVKADAKPSRVLRIVGNMLTANFLEYKNWKSTLKDSLSYIKAVLSPLPLVGNPVMAFSLRYIDRYTFDGPADEPRAEMLLRKGCGYITARCFEGGPLWHCHSGWFDPLETGDRILNQLNVGSAMVDQAPTVTVDHNAIYQLTAPRQTIEALFQPSSEKIAHLEHALNDLHRRNGMILRAMLVPDMLSAIGMET